MLFISFDYFIKDCTSNIKAFKMAKQEEYGKQIPVNNKNEEVNNKLKLLHSLQINFCFALKCTIIEIRHVRRLLSYCTSTCNSVLLLIFAEIWKKPTPPFSTGISRPLWSTMCRGSGPTPVTWDAMTTPPIVILIQSKDVVK